MVTVIDNFFDEQSFYAINDYVRKLKFYDYKWHKKVASKNWTGSFPGKRSVEFFAKEPLLATFIMKTMIAQYNFNRNISGTLWAHLRLKDNNNQDWIHRDPNQIGFLYYLSETNLNSGTKFFSNNVKDNSIEVSDKESDDLFVKFLQNRAIIFDGQKLHCSYNNHGNNMKDGRLTINGFFDYV